MRLDEVFDYTVAWLEGVKARDGKDLLVTAHLKTAHEGREFADAPSLEEWADVFMCLVGAARQRGWTAAQCAAAVSTKVSVNWSREWVQQPDGTWQHEEVSP